MRRRFSAVVPVAALCSAAAVAMAAGPSSSATANRAAARADAVRLLGELNLPAGAKRSASEPAGDGGRLQRPWSYPATSNLVDRHQWWVVSRSPRQLVSYVKAHPPRGGSKSMEGGSVGVSAQDAKNTSVLAIGFGFPAQPTVFRTRELILEATRLADGKTGVRVDAEDVWITPRRGAERISDRENRLKVTVKRFTKRTKGPFTFTDPKKVAPVIDLLNSLPLFQPGPVSCPGDDGTVIRLAFAGSGGPAVAAVHPGGCGAVALTLDGKRQPILASYPIPGHPHATLVQLLERDLGVRL